MCQLRSCRHRAGGLGNELVAANIRRWESVLILINEILPVTITLTRSRVHGECRFSLEKGVSGDGTVTKASGA